MKEINKNQKGAAKSSRRPGAVTPLWMLSKGCTLDSLNFAKFNREFDLKMKRDIEAFRNSIIKL